MKKILLIFGNITFNHFTNRELELFKDDNEPKALIHSIDEKFLCESEDEANQLIDKLENRYFAWIIPSQFAGEIIFEPNPEIKEFENLV